MRQKKEFNFKSYDNSKQTISYCEVDKCDKVIKLKQAIEKIKELIQKEIDDCEHRDDCTSCEYNCCIRQAMRICNEVTSE